MLGTALVAVVAGVRLVNGTMAFEDALVVLLLAPEIYGPLRRAGRRVPRGGRRAGDAAAAARGHRCERGGSCRGTPGGARRRPARGRDRARARHGRHGGRTSAGRSTTCRWRSRPGRRPRSWGRAARASRRCCASCSGCSRSRSGTVRCGGLELGAMDLDAWRARIAWMPQRPVLLPATLAENLRLADADAGDERLWAALAAAGLEPWAAGLPGGLAARLGEGGVAASAGERRRARARPHRAARPRARARRRADRQPRRGHRRARARRARAHRRRPHRGARHPRPRRGGARGTGRRAGRRAAGEAVLA